MVPHSFAQFNVKVATRTVIANPQMLQSAIIMKIVWTGALAVLWIPYFDAIANLWVALAGAAVWVPEFTRIARQFREVCSAWDALAASLIPEFSI